MDSLEIVQVTSETLAALQSMHTANFGFAYDQDLYADVSHGFLLAGYMAKFADTLIGEVTVRWVNDNNFLSLYIVSLSVDVNYRGGGVGTKLLQHVFANHPDARSFLLHVDVRNENAYRLYKKFGFEVVKRVPHFYRNSDAYLMRAKNPDATPDVQNVQLARHLRTWYRNSEA